MASCLIKDSKTSSYGALSKAGIEYNTYLSYSNQEQILRKNDGCNSNLGIQQDSPDRSRPHSVYAGLSYVPFNYCDDLRIEDIFKRFKMKQDRNKDRESRLSGSTSPIFGSDETFDYDLDSTYKQPLVSRYSSCEGLPKSPKVRQRISFDRETCPSYEDYVPYSNTYKRSCSPESPRAEKRSNGGSCEKSPLKGILKVKESPFNNVIKRFDAITKERHDYEFWRSDAVGDTQNQMNRSSEILNGKSIEYENRIKIDEDTVSRKRKDKDNSYAYYDEGLQEWLNLSNNATTAKKNNIGGIEFGRKTASPRISVSTGSSPVERRRVLNSNFPRCHVKVKPLEQKFKATIQRSDGGGGGDENADRIRIKVNEKKNRHSICLTLETNGEDLDLEKERKLGEITDQVRANDGSHFISVDEQELKNQKVNGEKNQDDKKEYYDYDDERKQNSDKDKEENKTKTEETEERNKCRNDNCRNYEEEKRYVEVQSHTNGVNKVKNNGTEVRKWKEEGKTVSKNVVDNKNDPPSKHNSCKNVKSYLKDCFNRGVALGAMLSNGQIAKTILYELKDNAWFHHNTINSEKNLNLDKDIDSLLKIDTGTIVCLTLTKTKLLF